MKRWLGWLGLLVCLVGTWGTGARAATEPFKEMTVAEVAKHLHDKGFYVYDANGEKVYDEAHVPGATRIAFDEVKADKLPKDKQATLIFYCKNPH